jgi:hypothetical protein
LKRLTVAGLQKSDSSAIAIQHNKECYPETSPEREGIKGKEREKKEKERDALTARESAWPLRDWRGNIPDQTEPLRHSRRE